MDLDAKADASKSLFPKIGTLAPPPACSAKSGTYKTIIERVRDVKSHPLEGGYRALWRGVASHEEGAWMGIKEMPPARTRFVRILLAIPPPKEDIYHRCGYTGF